jgi:mycofactocin system FadH/OYE family oxidoreductase 2
MGRYRYLFSPLQLGPITVRNRIVFSAHLTNYAEDGLATEQHAAYYEARAKGGAGLIITEEHSTHPTDWPYEKLIHGFHREVIPGYKRITEAVHRHGTPIFAQINHNGGQASSMYSRLPVWAPSAVADPLFREVPKAVNTREIAEIVAGYGLVAGHCAEGGFDGVELQCSHSSIVRGFLSGATNMRTDHYGGSLENRARILIEIVDVVREAIGPTRALGVRLCGDELIEGGTTIDEAVAVAKLVEATGKVDYINTSIGVATATLFMIEASMHIPPGYALFIPNAIRREVAIPVVGVGRFKDPIQAERALADGHCDLVGAVRAQIADPDFVRKAESGEHDDTRLCLSCNQECVGRMGLNRWLGCIENPHTGREALEKSLLSISSKPNSLKPKRVMVIGAGPAGMQAAISAASRGHDAVVYERDDIAGGQVRWAASVANRAEFGDMIRNQLNELERLHVKVAFGHEVDVEFVHNQNPDAVIVATGSTPARPYWAPGNESRIVDVLSILSGACKPGPGTKVVIVDELGFHQATSVAELLADRGCNVEILTPGMVVGQDLGITLDMEGFCIRAAAKNISLTPDSVVMGWDADTSCLSVLHHVSGQMNELSADIVVLAVPGSPSAQLYFDLLEAGINVYRIGDALTPRRAHSAIIDGDRVGAML